MPDALSEVLPVELASERLELLGERAVWWPARRTMLLADAHLGKAGHFRKAGIPVLGYLREVWRGIAPALALAAGIGYPDMVSLFAGTTLNQTGQAIEVIAITMSVYLAISISISILMNW